MSSRQVVVVGDWNAVLDPDIDPREASRITNKLDAKYFRVFVVNKFRQGMKLKKNGLGPVGASGLTF